MGPYLWAPISYDLSAIAAQFFSVAVAVLLQVIAVA